MLLPIITGLAKYKYWTNAYRGFFSALVVSFLNQNLSLLSNEPVILNLANYTYMLLWSICMMYALLSWLEQQHIQRTLIIYTVLLMVLLTVEILWQELTVFRSSALKSVVYACVLCFAVRALVVTLGDRTEQQTRLSKILLLAPLIVFTIYYISLNILMHFLFNYKTMKLFQSLFSVINIINTLSYLSFTLAFLWAPKKEKFL